MIAKLSVDSLDTFKTLLSGAAVVLTDDDSKVSIDRFARDTEYISASDALNFMDYLFKPSQQRKYLFVRAGLTYRGKPPERLSVGQRGTFFLCMKLATDLARAVRAREATLKRTHADVDVKPTPIVGVTANAQREAVTQALDAGMTQCLVKPLGLDALRRAPVSIAAAAEHPLPVLSSAAYARFFPVSNAPIRFSRRFARGRAYGPVHVFPSNTVCRQAVVSMRNASRQA